MEPCAGGPPTDRRSVIGTVPQRGAGEAAVDMSDLAGGVVGFAAGMRLRRAYFGFKLRRVDHGKPLKLRCRAHPTGAPEWKLWRGSLVATTGELRFRAVLRRWRQADLSHVEVIG